MMGDAQAGRKASFKFESWIIDFVEVQMQD
jgi:hypothetical protein